MRKLIAFFLLLCLMCPSKALFSQSDSISTRKELSTKGETGEIWLTMDELESLLTKIAERRKAALQQQEANFIRDRGLESASAPSFQLSLEQQMALLNQKLDWLLAGVSRDGVSINMLNQGQQPGSTTFPINYLQPNVQHAGGQVINDSFGSKYMDKEVNVTNPTPGLVEEHLRELRPSWGRSIVAAKSIYFKHNHSDVDQNYFRDLDALAAILKKLPDESMLVLRGYASKVGNAFYNHQLSFNRADAVKAYLMKQGVQAGNILIMHHGADPNSSDETARRVDAIVEISTLVQPR